MLPSSSTNWGIGEHTMKTVSTPCNACFRPFLSAKSASTVGTPGGAFFASSALRYMALNGLPALRTSSRTARPTVPDAPVIRIIVFTFLSASGAVRGAADLHGTRSYEGALYNRGELDGSTHK